MAVYVPESFTADEADVLRRYFTKLDGPVFALVRLPEVRLILWMSIGVFFGLLFHKNIVYMGLD